MKKLLLAILVLLLLTTGFIYYYIPGTLIISEAVLTRCTQDGAFRYLSNEDNRKKWWPGGDTLVVVQKLRDQLDVIVKYKGSSISGRFIVFPLPEDSSAIEWQGSMTSNLNPIKRVLAYQEAKALKERMHEILIALQGFIDKPQNIYGIDIKETSITDTLLISTKANFTRYPATADIYRLITKLQDYGNHQKARSTGNPLLNVEKQADSGYYVRVALPVDKVLQGTDGISFTRMIPGRFMVADIYGGPGTVAEAMKQMHQYFEDYRRTSMAIPFQVLVTDRRDEPDTSKWKTRIYAPVY